MELVAEGTDLNTLGSYESLFGERDKGEVRFYLNESVSQEELQYIQDELLNQGVTLTKPVAQEARILAINFEKRIAPLVIIVAVVGVVIAGILGWQLFEAVEEVPNWLWIGGGLGLLYLISRR